MHFKCVDGKKEENCMKRRTGVSEMNSVEDLSSSSNKNLFEKEVEK
ncbi:MAG: hypothetical protein HXS48_25625 [Theionarchaea archaeon]|nr:hypothetical protein [Theionarchaea archaeon]